MLVAHASKASRAKRSAAGIVTPFVSCASTDHGDSQQLSLHFSISGLLYSTHFIYIIILALLYAKILRFQRTQTLVNKRWPSVAAQLPTLLETRPQQHATMCREHPNRTCRHKLCMRMQATAHTLLCTAKHDCTMNALRTGHSQHERQGSRPNRHDADNEADPIRSMPSAWPQSSCSC